jgi:hypothetical protein
MKVIDLAAPRTIAMQFGARTYTWTFRRLLRSDWESFFRGFETETVQMLGQQDEIFEIETSLVELARETVIEVEGYAMPATGDWRRMLPNGHLKAFGLALRDVRTSADAEDEAIALTELHEVRLDCVWSRDPQGADGAMQEFTGLVHRLSPPTVKQQRAFNRASNTHRVVGDDRGGRTIYPARQRLMIDFYDELIHSVDEAYQVDGVPLATRDAAIAEMDACHKVAAVQGFLNAGGTGRIVMAKGKRAE